MTFALAMLAEAGTAATGDQSAWIAAGFILLAAGVVLGVLEIFVPTGGLLAAATATCFVASVVMFFLHGALWGFAALLAYSAGAPFAAAAPLSLFVLPIVFPLPSAAQWCATIGVNPMSPQGREASAFAMAEAPRASASTRGRRGGAIVRAGVGRVPRLHPHRAQDPR